MKKIISILIGVIFMISAIGSAGGVVPEKKTIERVRSQLRKYAPVKIAPTPGRITEKDKKFLAEMIAAAKIMDELFLIQVWEENPKLRAELEKKEFPEKSMLLEFFDLNAGPFDRLDEHKAFLEIGMEEQPATAGFYPPSITEKEWDGWLERNPKDSDSFTSNFTVIKRKDGKFEAVKYSKYYEPYLKRAAKHLREAAKHTNNASLRKYLTSRAAAFESNDYYQSDCDWVDLKDHKFEIVIGPYEVYEDRFKGYKAAFEAFITLVDKKESEKLGRIKSYMGDFEKHLPIDDKYKNTKRGTLSPIIVAELILSAGDTKAGVQTLAFNLPNDERVRENKGSKKVMLKNVSEAKFNEILIPIAKLTMDPSDAKEVSFDAFFGHTLTHEVSHGIGPGTITVKGKETTVNKALEDQYSVIEEAKADTLGLYNNLYLIEKGMYPKGFEKTLYATYLAGLFRSMRFGISEAHGGANAIQFNYLKSKGAITFDKATGTFKIDRAKMPKAIEELAHELLMIEAKGDYKGAVKFVKKYRVMPEDLKAALAKLNAVPVDIRPIYSYR